MSSTLHKLLLVACYNYCKKEQIHLINTNDRTITRILIILFLVLKVFKIVNDKQTTNELNPLVTSRTNLYDS